MKNIFDFVFTNTGSYAYLLGRNLRITSIDYSIGEWWKDYPNLHGFVICNLLGEDAITIRNKLEKYSGG